MHRRFVENTSHPRSERGSRAENIEEERTPAGFVGSRGASPVDARGSTSTIAAVLLVGMVTVLGAGVAVAGVGMAETAMDDPATTAMLSLEVEDDRVELSHRRGDPLEIEQVRLRISVGGETLAHQPELPFFSQRGFAPGPSGPFNSATDSTWRAGESATLRIAGTNRPTPEPGATVRVQVFDGDTEIADLSATA